MSERAELIVRFPDDAPDPGATLPAVRGIDPYGALLADAKAATTQAARARDVTYFARYLGLVDPARAAALLVSGSAGHANALALGFLRAQLDAQLAPATINRRLSTLRRLVKLSKRLGLVDWLLDVDTLRSVPCRDTAGPGHGGWLTLLAVGTALAASRTPKGTRDLAILRLLHDRGLRRGELIKLDLADVDLDERRIAVVGKGRSEREWLAINRPTAAALEVWIRARGTAKGALFVSLHEGKGRLERLTGAGVHWIVRSLGRRACLPRRVWPHGLRHASITRALDLTNGNVRDVQRFSRHKSIATVTLYDDARTDVARSITDLIGEG
jgi:integrase/recombinase XerC